VLAEVGDICLSNKDGSAADFFLNSSSIVQLVSFSSIKHQSQLLKYLYEYNQTIKTLKKNIKKILKELSQLQCRITFAMFFINRNRDGAPAGLIG
jgi:hypothetical protein